MGLENAFLRHRLLAEAVRRAVSVWSEGQVLGFNIAEAPERSNTVTTVTMNGRDPAALQRYCKEKCGVVPLARVPYRAEADALGRPGTLWQNGWQIQYTEYAAETPGAHPTRLQLNFGDIEARMIVSEWNAQ